MEKKIMYFERAGRENTDVCLQIVKDAVRDYNYKHLVIASTGGYSGMLFSEAMKGSGVSLTVVTHCAGFKEPNSCEMSADVRQKITNDGAKVYTGTMVTHSLETALASKFSGTSPSLIVAHALRRFGEGTKVCCEIVMMAADAGLIPEGEEVLAVAGTGRGSDTVLLIKSAVSKRFFDLVVLEVLAKPRA